ncbi:response regulator [Archangium violaceum]|uniref:response regulator n=1 Tax=Archangium violaceum TaxID=83451 RepID=UPI00193B2AAE|nr:response regulator [Archangium violaceum]QRK10209.1 response regulator [Archangium violaceum]
MATLRGPVLIVEDDPDIREALQNFLESNGYPVLAASHGKEALELIGHGPRPAVVVLDMSLPVMDGNRLLTARKGDATLRSIPVIILSAAMAGMSPRDRALYASSYGVAAFLGKPAEPQQVLEAVERHSLKAEEPTAGVPV